MIFVRDIYKQWYVSGINSVINNVDSTIEFIRKETANYSVSTCGNLAGGYMAILVGCILGAERVFSFLGQFSCEDQIEKAPLLHKYKSQYSRYKYYNLSSIIKNYEVELYHFYPGMCEWDIQQLSFVSGRDIKFIPMNSNVHGETVSPICYKYLLTSENENLNSLFMNYRKLILKECLFLFWKENMQK